MNTKQGPNWLSTSHLTSCQYPFSKNILSQRSSNTSKILLSIDIKFIFKVSSRIYASYYIDMALKMQGTQPYAFLFMLDKPCEIGENILKTDKNQIHSTQARIISKFKQQDFLNIFDFFTNFFIKLSTLLLQIIYKANL